MANDQLAQDTDGEMVDALIRLYQHLPNFVSREYDLFGDGLFEIYSSNSEDVSLLLDGAEFKLPMRAFVVVNGRLCMKVPGGSSANLYIRKL